MCLPMARSSGSSRRRASAWTSTRRPTSRSEAHERARLGGHGALHRARERGAQPSLPRAARSRAAPLHLDFVYGEVYAGDVLDAKTRALCTVAMLASTGQQLQLGVYVRSARRQGASEEEIREVLRQVAVYAGFPAAWNALATMRAALGDEDGT